jgi:hypothetical protein
MPYTIDVSTSENVVYLKGIGDLSVESSLEAAANVVNHPDVQPHFGMVVDFGKATNTPTLSEMRILASSLGKYAPSLKGRIGLRVLPGDVNKAGVLCVLVRVFGVKMEAYSDLDQAYQYVRIGRAGF